MNLAFKHSPLINAQNYTSYLKFALKNSFKCTRFFQKLALFTSCTVRAINTLTANYEIIRRLRSLLGHQLRVTTCSLNLLFFAYLGIKAYYISAGIDNWHPDKEQKVNVNLHELNIKTMEKFLQYKGKLNSNTRNKVRK